MCLIVFSYKTHPEYPLILAANRDEFYERLTEQAHVWNTDPEIVAGKDLKAGGTWLAVSKNGEFGAITNYRDMNHPRNGQRSRGEIILNFLTGEGSPEEKISGLQDHQSKYDGFNLLAGNLNNLYYLSNISQNYQAVQAGLHGISNAFLDTSWPKVDKAKEEFGEILSSEEIDKERVFQLLRNKETFPEDQLPKTGLTTEMEKKVSPIFIQTAAYGTRSSSLLMIDKKGNVSFTEKTYKPEKSPKNSLKHFDFSIHSQP